MAAQWKPKRGRKLKLDEVKRALAAHDRAQAASDAIRRETVPPGKKRRPGRGPLPPVPENSVVRAWRAQLAEQHPLSPSVTDPLEELRKAIAAKKRAETRIMAAARAAKDAAGAATVAGELGMTRQGVYAMLARS